MNERYYRELIELLSHQLEKDKYKLSKDLKRKLTHYYNNYSITYQNDTTKITIDFIDLRKSDK